MADRPHIYVHPQCRRPYQVARLIEVLFRAACKRTFVRRNRRFHKAEVSCVFRRDRCSRNATPLVGSSCTYLRINDTPRTLYLYCILLKVVLTASNLFQQQHSAIFFFLRLRFMLIRLSFFCTVISTRRRLAHPVRPCWFFVFKRYKLVWSHYRLPVEIWEAIYTRYQQ